MTLPSSPVDVSGYPVPVGPVIVQSGSWFTVRTTSSVLVQPLVSITVNRSVAVPLPVTVAVTGNEVQVVQLLPGGMVTGPDTVLQLIEAIGLSPGCAVPVRLNVVVPLG